MFLSTEASNLGLCRPSCPSPVDFIQMPESQGESQVPHLPVLHGDVDERNRQPQVAHLC